MFLGHVGVGLALKKAEPKLNVGWLVTASLFLDIVLWVLVLIGAEHVAIPPNYSDIHFLSFDFPYSHSLVAALLYSALAFGVGCAVIRTSKRLRAGIILGAAVFLHWTCDWIEHTQDLPLAGSSTQKLGLGLWDQMPKALGIEISFAAVGLWLYLTHSTEISSLRKWLIGLLTFFIAGMTVYGGLLAPAPPGETPLAVGSLATNILVVVLYFSLDRRRTIQ